MVDVQLTSISRYCILTTQQEWSINSEANKTSPMIRENTLFGHRNLWNIRRNLQEWQL